MAIICQHKDNAVHVTINKKGIDYCSGCGKPAKDHKAV